MLAHEFSIQGVNNQAENHEKYLSTVLRVHCPVPVEDTASIL